MPLLEFLFSPQAHKFRNGYSINHDTLMNGNYALILVSPAARTKLIFYFIAEQLPQKLDAQDRTAYETERYNNKYSIGLKKLDCLEPYGCGVLYLPLLLY